MQYLKTRTCSYFFLHLDMTLSKTANNSSRDSASNICPPATASMEVFSQVSGVSDCPDVAKWARMDIILWDTAWGSYNIKIIVRQSKFDV